MKNELDRNYKSSQYKLKHEFEVIRAIINNKEKELNQELEKSFQTKMNQLDKLVTQIEQSSR